VLVATRTTLALDDDVLAAAKAIAQRDRRSTGEVISDLARQGIKSGIRTELSPAGYRVLPRRGAVVTLDLVNALRDEDA
jgi:hypothetical protein